jgi:cell wall-associated NlpC family hydrolase
VSKLGPEQIFAIALQAGFSRDQAVTFTAIALAESGGNTNAHATGIEDSRGLWQINIDPRVRANKWGNLYDPVINAQAAYEVSGHGQNLRPWSVTHASNAGTNRDYRTYMDQALAAANATPDGAQHTSGVDVFVEKALEQDGDSYVFGHEVNLDDPNPNRFDCSELVEWAAHQAGVKITDGAAAQYLSLRGQHSEISVEQALHTKGALLFSFSSPPVPGQRPAKAHVAISLGDGRTIEAANPQDGVGIHQAGNRFNYAGVIPGLATATPVAPPPPGPEASSFDLKPAALPDPTDDDHDGLTRSLEQLLGLNPDLADSDDDGTADLAELVYTHTDPLKADTDGDGSSDSAEDAAHTDAGHYKLPTAARNTGIGDLVDSDTDDVADHVELQRGMNPDDPDSDHDGVIDGVELAYGLNPMSIDSNLDGVTDAVALQMGMVGPGTSTPAPSGAPDPTTFGGDDAIDASSTH